MRQEEFTDWLSRITKHLNNEWDVNVCVAEEESLAIQTQILTQFATQKNWLILDSKIAKQRETAKRKTPEHEVRIFYRYLTEILTNSVPPKQENYIRHKDLIEPVLETRIETVLILLKSKELGNMSISPYPTGGLLFGTLRDRHLQSGILNIFYLLKPSKSAIIIKSRRD